MRTTIFCLLTLLSVQVLAQSTQIDTTHQLSDVSIVAQKINRLPGAGQVIDAKKIAMLNQPDINKVLRIVPGVQIRDEEGFGLRPNIGLRATPVNRSAKITIMEDGVLMSPAPYADPSAYYFPTFARMESVEVLKGSSQIKQGPYTIGGAINLISTSIPQTLQGQISAGYGSFGTNQQRVWIGNSGPQLDYVFDVSRIASAGFKDLDNGGKTGFDRRDFMAKIRLHNASTAKFRQSVTLKFLNMTEDGNESYLGLTFEDFKQTPNRRYAATQMDYLDLQHQHVSVGYLGSLHDHFQVSITGYYANTYRDWARVNHINGTGLMTILSNPIDQSEGYQVMTGKANGEIGFQSAARNFYSQGVQTTIRKNLVTGNVRHEIQFGARFHQDQADRYATLSTYQMNNGWMALSEAGIKGNAENQIRKAESVSGFLQYELQYKRLTITPGIRLEQIKLENHNYGVNDVARWGANLTMATNELNVFLPGIGFNVVMNHGMSLFGGLHKGFSPPGTPSAASASSQAMAETAMNYELGYRLKNKNLRTQLVGFYSDYDNILGSDNFSGGGAGTGDMFNAGRAKVYGVEVSVDWNLWQVLVRNESRKLNLAVAYTYSDARFADTFENAGGDWGSGVVNAGDQIPFITPHLLTASLVYEQSKLNIALVGRYVGLTSTKPDQGTWYVPSDAVNYNDVNAIDASFVMDVSANYRWNQRLTTYCAINNALNTSYIVANLPQGYRPGMPLSVMVGLKCAL